MIIVCTICLIGVVLLALFLGGLLFPRKGDFANFLKSPNVPIILIIFLITFAYCTTIVPALQRGNFQAVTKISDYTGEKTIVIFDTRNGEIKEIR